MQIPMKGPVSTFLSGFLGLPSLVLFLIISCSAPEEPRIMEDDSSIVNQLD